GAGGGGVGGVGGGGGAGGGPGGHAPPRRPPKGADLRARAPLAHGTALAMTTIDPDLPDAEIPRVEGRSPMRSTSTIRAILGTVAASALLAGCGTRGSDPARARDRARILAHTASPP